MSALDAPHVPSSLTLLPFEVLRRVVELGPCESALTLGRVCRVFRDLCDDPLIYGAIIRNGSGLDRAYEPARWSEQGLISSPRASKMWWEVVLRHHNGGDPSSASHWALADSRAFQYVQQPPAGAMNGVNLPVDFAALYGHARAPPPWTLQLLSYLPELLIVRHPRAQDLSTRSEAELKSLLWAAEESGSRETEWRATFICANSVFTSREDPTISPGGGQLCFTIYSNSHVKRDLSDALDRPLFYNPDPHDWTHQLHANLAVGRVRAQLKLASIWDRSEGNLAPPTASQIPMHLHARVKAPFSRDCKLGTAHLDTMTSPEFLSAGEWVGYYNYSFNLHAPISFDPMMSGIRFQTLADDQAVRVFAPAGEDMRGPFELYGHIWRESGGVTVVKEYASGVRWQWIAAMTPFGIVGSWGSVGHGGWLWLWKRSWSPIRNEQPPTMPQGGFPSSNILAMMQGEEY